jgi:hypothetical protein
MNGALDNEEMPGGINQQQSSVKSSMCSDSSRRKHINEAINSSNEPIVIKGINYIGKLALLVLIVCSTIVYLVLKNSFSIEINTLNNLIIAPALQERIAAVIMNREFLRISSMVYNGGPPWRFSDQNFNDTVS